MTEVEDPQGRDPVVLLAADEAFAMPLAVTVRSALDNLASGRSLQIYVLDGGITKETKQRLVESWNNSAPYSLHWVKVDESDLAGIERAEHWNVVAYYRLLMPRILPLSLSRVIYLDSDIVVRRDLGKLWETALAGNACLAIQDCFAPYIDASKGMSNYRLAAPYVSCKPILNYAKLGLPPTRPYFNSGILLLDLEAWRTLDLTSRMIACLHENREFVRWTDQYALNAGLSGRWALLDPRWNQGAYVFEYPGWRYSPFDKTTYYNVCLDPYIVHFTTAQKPWHANSRHPFRHEFFQYLDRTAWSGWRPADDQSWSFWWRAKQAAVRKWLQNSRLRFRAFVDAVRNRQA